MERNFLFAIFRDNALAVIVSTLSGTFIQEARSFNLVLDIAIV